MLSLQAYYDFLRTGLSVRANHILEFSQLSDSKDVLNRLTDKNKILLLRNCGQKTVTEIYELVCKLKEYKLSLKLSEENEPEQDSDNSDYLSIQEQYNQLLANLSVRTYNIAREQGLLTINAFIPYIQATEKDFLKFRHCGRKSAYEFLDLASKVQKIIISCFPLQQYKNEQKFPAQDSICLSEEENNFIYSFHEKYAHWPLIFILGKYVVSVLSKYERMVLNLEGKHEELDTLPNYRVQQIYEKAIKRIKMSNIFSHLDWNYYGISELPPLIVAHIEDLPVMKKWQIEKADYFNTIHKQSSQITQTTLLQLLGMSYYWFDFANKEIIPYNPFQETVHPSCFIGNQYTSFKFNKAFKEVTRLQSIKTTENVTISILGYFVNNNDYWEDAVELSDEDRKKMSVILIKLFEIVCYSTIENGNLLIKANKIDYASLLYEILKTAGTRLHRDELYKRLINTCIEKGLSINIPDSSQLITYLIRHSKIVSYGKSSYWGLKEWGEYNGSIREIAIQLVKKTKQPIPISELAKLVIEKRPDSNEKSVNSIIRQTTTNGELVLFFDDYVGCPKRTYSNEYIIVPQTFDEWRQTFKNFVLKNKRFPYGGQNGYEGYLYRWYNKVSRLTDLSSEEILKIDALEKELSHYPHNATEYKFLQNCNLYRNHVERNHTLIDNVMDSDLYGWYYTATRNYHTYQDNRKKYFAQLLRCISEQLY